MEDKTEVLVTTGSISENSSTNAEFKNTTGAADFHDIYDPEKYGITKRGLSPRHVSLMIIGGSIGTGLFVGVSGPLMRAGPLPLFLGFLFYAVFVVWSLLYCVAEMCSWLPIKGSVFHFCARWYDPALGFAAGWMYAYGATMFVSIEFTAVAGVIGFWSDLNPGIWVAISLVLSLAVNVAAVKFYGESEFIACSSKVLLILGLMLFTLITMCGANPMHWAYGFSNWQRGGLVHEYLVEGTTGRFLAFWSVLIYAAFAVGGADVLMMIAGEVQHPRKVIPSGGQKAYIRIVLFYVLGIFFMNCLCASNNPLLLEAYNGGASGAGMSPWVMGIRTLGVKGLDQLINALIMLSAWSCGNTFVYTSSRSYYALSLAGYAPKIFSRCLKNGVPIYAVLFVGIISCISFLTCSNSTVVVFNWFVNLGTTAYLILYACVFFVYIRFHKAIIAQGVGYKNLYYNAPLNIAPYHAYVGLFLTCLILLFAGFDIFFPGRFSVSGLFTYYFADAFFFVIFFAWKFYKKTKIRDLMEVDLFTGKAAIDKEEEEENIRNPIPTTGLAGFAFKYLY